MLEHHRPYEDPAHPRKSRPIEEGTVMDFGDGGPKMSVLRALSPVRTHRPEGLDHLTFTTDDPVR
jgi:hypothetical protein